MQTYNVARRFTQFPGGRYRKHGKGSGEAFREDVLIPFLEAGVPAEIDLDGASGYPPSFLDEAFGGLVRAGYSEEKIRQVLRLKAGPAFEMYVTMIWSYVEKASQQHAHH